MTFAELVKDDWLPESRAKTCRDDFQTLAFAMRTLITPHIDQDLAKPIHDISWLPANTPVPQVTRAATEEAKSTK